MDDTLVLGEVFPPGEFLRDELEERGWTVAEFAEIIGRPAQAISEILNGRKEITTATAAELARGLGTSAELWLNLQTSYRLGQVRRDAPHLRDVDRRRRVRELVPTTELRARGWITDTDDLVTQEAEVCDLLGIPEIDAAPYFALAARRSDGGSPLRPAQMAWLGRLRQLSAARQVGRFDSGALEVLTADLPSRLHDVGALRSVTGWLAEVGVALVVIPALKRSKVDGAALRLPSGAAAVGLSLRGRRLDGAVFTLLHELAHVLLGHIDQGAALDEALSEGAGGDPLEVEADARATTWLFPGGLDVQAPISSARVREVAQRRGVHPALVVGRLHWEGRLPWANLTKLVPAVSVEDWGDGAAG